MSKLLSSVLMTCAVAISAVAFAADTDGQKGYYRDPAIHGDTVVFTAQGDLWKVGISGGQAHALTFHAGQEMHAAISPDGKTVAFTASYEGPNEVYIMPLAGGLPKRLTYQGGATVVGWTPDNRVLYATGQYATLFNAQLATVDPNTQQSTLLPLNQASEGCYDTTGKTLFFTRLPFQGSHTRRYQGGTAQNLWKYVTDNTAEAVPLTGSYPGTSKNPMWWNGRLYFLSDRDGTMNLWSMDAGGGGLKQLSHQAELDIQSFSLDNGRIVYQLGADLHLYTIATGMDTTLDITLESDFDQTRERWITRPMDYLTNTMLSADGSHVALTARGQVFIAPAGNPGRLVEATRKRNVRYRNALFAPDGKTVYALSDETGETEWWSLPANGVGSAKRLTQDAKVLRTGGAVSPDGKWLAYGDKDQELWILDLTTGASKKVASSKDGEFYDYRWSPDSKWLAYVLPTSTFARLALYSLATEKSTPITTDRADSYSPAWSPDGKWLYFLSDRTFRSLVGSPWGPRQPEPFFPEQARIYQIALKKGSQRSPFAPTDELQNTEPTPTPMPPAPAPATPTPAVPTPNNPGTTPPPPAPATPVVPPPAPKPTPTPSAITIELDGIAERLQEVPIPAGNYESLEASDNRLFLVARETSADHTASLLSLDITNKDIAVKSLVSGIGGYDLSQDGKKLLINRSGNLYVIDASAGSPANLGGSQQVDLSGWSFSVDPREEWRAMLVEAWRLHRDYFYDRKMHGVDWNATLKRYLPLVDRVRDRAELSDLLGQMVGELSALHTFVEGGDQRSGDDHISSGSLGATLSRDEARGGWRIDRIYHGDPDYPNTLAPLVRPGVNISEGDILQMINGVDTLSVPDPAVLLRNQTGKQVLLKVRDGKTGAVRDVIAVPISRGQLSDLRYTDWELSRRRQVDSVSKGDIGYVHLRAMGDGDMAQWTRDFYPVFNRSGLIIDVRHNQGGNIDSWVLEKLLRRAWFYWQPRVGNPSWNMPFAFRGHVVVLCDEWTASDGEAFSEGIKRLGVGKVIGTRTWGGEIWLSFDNTLVDNGIASAAETGVFGPEGKWLIEGHGVDPDIIVDNLPHATFMGKDAQLEAAIAYLQKEIKAHPIPAPVTPGYPNKAIKPRP